MRADYRCAAISGAHFTARKCKNATPFFKKTTKSIEVLVFRDRLVIGSVAIPAHPSVAGALAYLRKEAGRCPVEAANPDSPGQD
jgi:hypothetical protein